MPRSARVQGYATHPDDTVEYVTVGSEYTDQALLLARKIAFVLMARQHHNLAWRGRVDPCTSFRTSVGRRARSVNQGGEVPPAAITSRHALRSRKPLAAVLLPGPPLTGDDSARRRASQRCADSLIGNGQVGAWGDLVRPIAGT